MRIVFSLILLLSIARAETGGLTALPAGPDTFKANILSAANAGFEAGASWTLGSGASYSTDQARTGTRSLAITNAATSNTNIAVTANWRLLRLRFWYKTAGGDPGSTARVYGYLFDSSHGGAAFACGSQVNISGGVADWTQYALCDYLAVPSDHYGDTLQLRIYGLNIPAGVTLYVDDVSIEPIERPLALMVTYPNYRGMLWGDQGTTITWRSIVEAPTGYALDQLKTTVDVVSSDGSTVISTVTSSPLAAAGATAGWAGYSVTSGSYAAGGLADGVCYLRARLRLVADDTVLFTYPDYKIVKEAASVQRNGWKVWVDSSNRVVLNGVPTFIWGTFYKPSVGRNTFPTGAGCDPCTTADGYRKAAMGCGPAGTCTAASPMMTPWNRAQGLAGSTFIKTLADLGINTVIYYSQMSAGNPGINATCDAYSSSSDHINPWMVALQDYGMWHLHIAVEYWASASYRPPFWDTCTASALTDGDKARAAVQALTNFLQAPATRIGNKGGFAGLYLSDEPSENAASAYKNAAASFDKWRGYADQHLGGITYWVDGPPGSATFSFDRWNLFSDTMGTDPYPYLGALPDDYIAGNMSAIPRHWRSVNWPRRSLESVFYSRPSLTTVQLFQASIYWPTESFQKIQVVGALASGTTGIFWWQHGTGNSSGMSVKTEAEYLIHQRVAKRISELLPILAEPILDLSDGPQGFGALVSSVSDPAVKCSSRQRGSQILLACANSANVSKAVTITMTAAIPGAVVRHWDGSAITPTGATFSDTFVGLQDATAPENSVHLYLIDLAPAALAIKTG